MKKTRFLICLVILPCLACGNAKLTSIEVQPSSYDFPAPDPTQQLHLTALGFYEHPPVVEDITSRATWTSDRPQVASVDAGVVTVTGTECGTAQIMVSMNGGPGGTITGSATIIVSEPSNPNCP